MVKGSSLSTRVISIQCSLLILIKFEISEKKEMSNLSLSQWYSLLYEKRLKDVKLDIDMTLDVLRRRKNFESPVTTKDNTHDGESLMRKAAEFKRYIANDLSGAWARCLPSGGQLPSGKTKADIQLATLKLLWVESENNKKINSKSLKGYVIQDYNPLWRPTGWQLFVEHGMASDNCHTELRYFKSNGPGQVPSCASDVNVRKGRKRQREEETTGKHMLTNKLSTSELESQKERRLLIGINIF